RERTHPRRRPRLHAAALPAARATRKRAQGARTAQPPWVRGASRTRHRHALHRGQPGRRLPWRLAPRSGPRRRGLVRSDRAGMRILIVEDEPLIRERLLRMCGELAGGRARFDAVADLDLAGDRLQRSLYDGLLLDLNL